MTAATKKTSAEKHLLAGTISGAVSTFMVFPLDLIKVRYQVHEGKTSAYSSIIEAFRTIRRVEGLSGFYQGVIAATMASAVSWGGYFYFYETAKKRKRDAVGNTTTDAFDHLLAGVEAGSIMVVLTNPLWLIKTRLQIQGRDQALKKYAGTTDAIRTIFREEGVQGFYKGFVPAILLTSHGAIQFAVYEYLKALYARSYSHSSSSSQPAQVSFIIGGASKIIAATITYPYQVVKSRLQQRGNMLVVEVAGKGSATVAKYAGTIDCLRNIWINEGIRGYFKGSVSNILRVAPSAALNLVLYEEFLKVLEK